jgi:hypothetical protein
MTAFSNDMMGLESVDKCPSLEDLVLVYVAASASGSDQILKGLQCVAVLGQAFGV